MILICAQTYSYILHNYCIIITHIGKIYWTKLYDVMMVILFITNPCCLVQCRHEEAARRPVFSAIVTMLGHDDSMLLCWNEEDISCCPLEAKTLGAPKEASKELYKDLQDYYTTKAKDRT